MKRPEIIILTGLVIGLLLFICLNVFVFFEIAPFGMAFNNFFAMVGLIVFFISGFFYISYKTTNN